MTAPRCHCNLPAASRSTPRGCLLSCGQANIDTHALPSSCRRCAFSDWLQYPAARIRSAFPPAVAGENALSGVCLPAVSPHTSILLTLEGTLDPSCREEHFIAWLMAAAAPASSGHAERAQHQELLDRLVEVTLQPCWGGVVVPAVSLPVSPAGSGPPTSPRGSLRAKSGRPQSVTPSVDDTATSSAVNVRVRLGGLPLAVRLPFYCYDPFLLDVAAAFAGAAERTRPLVGVAVLPTFVVAAFTAARRERGLMAQQHQSFPAGSSSFPTASLTCSAEAAAAAPTPSLTSLPLPVVVRFDGCGLFSALHPYQMDGVAFALRRGGRVLFADEMGLGKTAQALATAFHFRSEWPLLVVCPASLTANWGHEISHWCSIPSSRVIVVTGAKKPLAQPTLDAVAVVICSYSCVPAVANLQFRVVIVDECHYVKSGAAQRTKHVHGLCKSASRVLLLSGTPALSRPIELFTQLDMVNPRLFPSSMSPFAFRYCNAFSNRYTLDMSGHSNLNELNAVLRHVMIRRSKREVAKQLPSKMRQILYLTLTNQERRDLEASRVRQQSAADFPGAGCDADVALRRLSNSFELFQSTAVAKIPAVVEYLKELLVGDLPGKDGTKGLRGDSAPDIARDAALAPPDEAVPSLVVASKMLIFAHHQPMLDAVCGSLEACGVDHIRIDGGTPSTRREPLCEYFRTHATCRAAVLSMNAAGTGLNLTCANLVVFTELTWNPSLLLQCEDRVHRIGQEEPCTIRYLLAPGSLDDALWPMLHAKLAVTSAVLSDEALGRQGEAGARLVDPAVATATATRRLATSSASQDDLDPGHGSVPLSARSTRPSQGTLDTWLSPRCGAHPASPHQEGDLAKAKLGISSQQHDDVLEVQPPIVRCESGTTPSSEERRPAVVAATGSGLPIHRVTMFLPPRRPTLSGAGGFSKRGRDEDTIVV